MFGDACSFCFQAYVNVHRETHPFRAFVSRGVSHRAGFRMAAKTAKLPKTDRGWQAYLSNIRTGGERRWLAMAGGLTICLEQGGGKTFQARIRRAGDTNARRINIGAFPAVSVSEARKRLHTAKAFAREGRDPAIEHRRKRAGVEEVRTLSALIDLYLRVVSGRGSQ